MLDSVKIQRRQSEIRQTLAGLVGKENPEAWSKVQVEQELKIAPSRALATYFTRVCNRLPQILVNYVPRGAVRG